MIMKRFKKIASLALALVMVMAMVMAFFMLMMTPGQYDGAGHSYEK